MADRRSTVAWWIAATLAAAVAALELWQWTRALLDGRPVIYGEGAVAHAALLFRDGSAYRDASGLVAANYPPLYLALASLGEPLQLGRAISIASALGAAAVLAGRAWDAGPLRAATVGLSWLALAPVATWAAAVKPDLLAVALTLAGVVLLERRGRGSALAAGVLFALAVWAKPTALMPAAAVLVWAYAAARGSFTRALAGAAGIAAVAVAHSASLDLADVWRHVVTWNALLWRADQLALLVVVTLGMIALLFAVASGKGAARGIALAYLAGAALVVVLGGREGATINYLLDLSAATVFALARVAVRLPQVGLALALQVPLTFATLPPLGFGPGRDGLPGAWGDPARVQVVAALGSGRHLVEDSGLLIATGQRPVADDLFLWSALVRSGTVDPEPLLGAVRRGELASVVSEVDLERLDRAMSYARSRWHPALAAAVLERYRLERTAGGLWVYRPK